MQIPPPPPSVHDTKVFSRIGTGDDDPGGLKEKALTFVKIANPLIDHVATGPFKFYTLHNRDHARKLLHLAENIVAKETLELLSSFECLLILYSSYLHDMGLALDQTEIEKTLRSEDFKMSLES